MRAVNAHHHAGWRADATSAFAQSPGGPHPRDRGRLDPCCRNQNASCGRFSPVFAPFPAQHGAGDRPQRSACRRTRRRPLDHCCTSSLSLFPFYEKMGSYTTNVRRRNLYRRLAYAKDTLPQFQETWVRILARKFSRFLAAGGRGAAAPGRRGQGARPPLPGASRRARQRSDAPCAWHFSHFALHFLNRAARLR